MVTNLLLFSRFSRCRLQGSIKIKETGCLFLVIDSNSISRIVLARNANLVGTGGGGILPLSSGALLPFVGVGEGKQKKETARWTVGNSWLKPWIANKKNCIFLVSFPWHKFLKEIFSFPLVKCKNDKNQSFISEITRKPFICEDGVV